MVPLRSRQFQAHSQQNVLHIFDKFCCNALSFIHFIIISRPGQSSFLSSCRNGQRRSIGSGSSSYKAGRNTKQARHNNTALHWRAGRPEPTVDSDFTWVSSCTPPTSNSPFPPTQAASANCHVLGSVLVLPTYR